MINRRPFVFFLALLLTWCCSCSAEKNPSAQNPAQETKASLTKKASLPFEAGETMRYAIKNLGVNAGEATILFKGIEKLKGNPVYLIVFTARSANFFDEEKIYADVKNFYPVVVERDLNIFGKKEKITEEYDQAKGLVKITRHAGRRTTEETIQKNGPIDNIYCFIYRYRQWGEFRMGDSFSIKLPTRDVTVDLVKTTTLKIGKQNHETFFMQSNPAKYKVWFDTSERKIPLRINGAVGISDTAMIMVNYDAGRKDHLMESGQKN